MQRDLGIAFRDSSIRTRQEFAAMVDEQMRLHDLNEKGTPLSQPYKDMLTAVTNLMQLFPELSAQEASLLAIHNQLVATEDLQKSTSAWKDRNKVLEYELEIQRANVQEAQELFQNEQAHIGAATAARQSALYLIELEAEMRRRVIQETIFDADKQRAALVALEIRTNAERMAVIRQYPTFWEQQLQAIVASNAFSLSAITGQWNSAIANAIVNGGTLEAAWKQTQVTMLQSAFQFVEQWLAQIAAGYSRELAQKLLADDAKLAAEIALHGQMISAHTAMESARTAATTAAEAQRLSITTAGNANLVATHTAMESAKTAATTAAETARLGIVMATNKAIIGGAIAALGSVAAVGQAALGVLAAALTGVVGFLNAVAAAVSMIPLVGQVLAGSLITGALLATFTGGTAIGIAAAALSVAIGAALVAASSAIAVPAFAEGGIVTGPTLGLVGERGPEAIIPLDRLAELGGGMRSGPTIIEVHVGSREVAREIFKELPAHVRLHGRFA
jgi:hypothetical protein